MLKIRILQRNCFHELPLGVNACEQSCVPSCRADNSSRAVCLHEEDQTSVARAQHKELSGGQTSMDFLHSIDSLTGLGNVNPCRTF